MDYASIVTVARELIIDTGRLITFEKLLAAAQDTERPWRGTGTNGQIVEDSIDVFGTFVPSQGSDLGSLVSDKELLKSVEQVCLVAGSEDQLETYTTLLDGEARYKVQWCQVLKPGDTVLLYVMGVAR